MEKINLKYPAFVAGVPSKTTNLIGGPRLKSSNDVIGFQALNRHPT